MAKYLQSSTDIEVNEVSGTDNIELNISAGSDIYTDVNNLYTAIESWAALSYSGAAIAGSDNDFNGFDTITSNGNVTTASNGVTIGDGVNCVLVSCSVGIQNASSSYNLCYTGFRLNGVQVTASFLELRNNNGSQGTITCPSIPIQVSQGDVITFYANGGSSASIRRASLNVIGLY